ncbi:hypothetical protein HDU96_002684 [Phlyctochytrium bullatum]|nr:hypothetical protein HDU96_002684 [Phlyctochytrium bullatum]
MRNLITHLATACDRMESDLHEAREQRDIAQHKLIEAGVALERMRADVSKAELKTSDAEAAAALASEVAKRKGTEIEELKQLLDLLRVEREGKDTTTVQRDQSGKVIAIVQIWASRIEDLFISAGMDMPIAMSYARPPPFLCDAQDTTLNEDQLKPVEESFSRILECIRRIVTDRDELKLRLSENGGRLREMEACLRTLERWRRSMEWHREQEASIAALRLSKNPNNAETCAVLEKIGKVKKELERFETTLQDNAPIFKPFIIR